MQIVRVVVWQRSNATMLARAPRAIKQEEEQAAAAAEQEEEEEGAIC